jgi:hypothetical protein
VQWVDSPKAAIAAKDVGVKTGAVAIPVEGAKPTVGITAATKPAAAIVKK